MARPLRLHLPHALFHVMSRGNAKQNIYLGDDDYGHFLELLVGTLVRFDVRCHAYCLMPNHFHLLLAPTSYPLSRMMQQLNSGYATGFNKRHERVGHVFQGRFKALVVNRDAYLTRLVRYIVLNPVRAGIVSNPGAWPWSSYRQTMGLGPTSFLSLEEVWGMFDPSDRRRAQARFATFVAESESESLPDASLVYGSPESAEQIAPLIERHRPDPEIVYREKFATRPPLEQLLPSSANRARQAAAMQQAFEAHGYTLRELGAFAGHHPTTIWRRIQQARRRAKGTSPAGRRLAGESA